MGLKEQEGMREQYRAAWGFTGHGQPLSYWSESDKREGGVGILLNPYLIPSATPTLQHLWPQHFIAVTVDMEDHRVMMLNIYAPHDHETREAFYRTLATETLRHQGPIFMGGDFNCTQQEVLDTRHERTAHRHVSAALTGLLEKWGFTDPLVAEYGDNPSADDVEEFRRTQHTYTYTFGGKIASSRLDRWYVSDTAMVWTRRIEVEYLGVGSDHAAAIMAVNNPAFRRRIRRSPTLYPPRRKQSTR